MNLHDTILEATGLGKIYSRRTTTTKARLRDNFFRTVWRRPDTSETLKPGEFWALRDVNLRLPRGRALGIIGLNGSGKTTLLRILAGQILPDAGVARVWGKSASMIDLTAGFQSAASGRQNIFLRSAALGRTREETAAAFDQISDFAELGNALEAPISTYSSGMRMRLAFSIMIATTPEILFIDEVLAVGDFLFKQKCLTRLREIRDETSFVMVSHSMADIARFCDEVVLLHHGEVLFHGDPEEAIAKYKEIETRQANVSEKPRSLVPMEVRRDDLLSDVVCGWSPSDDDGNGSVHEGDSLVFECSFKLHFDPTNLIVGVPIYFDVGKVATGLSTDGTDILATVGKGTEVRLKLKIPNITFNAGTYRAAIGITDGVEFLYMTELPNIHVASSGRLNWGDVTLEYDWACDASDFNT